MRRAEGTGLKKIHARATGARRTGCRTQALPASAKPAICENRCVNAHAGPAPVPKLHFIDAANAFTEDPAAETKQNQITPSKGNIMNSIKLLSATLLFAAASSAFAGTDDGVIDSFPAQTRVSQPAPAPTAAAAATRADAAKNAGKQDFTRQLSEGSGY